MRPNRPHLSVMCTTCGARPGEDCLETAADLGCILVKGGPGWWHNHREVDAKDVETAVKALRGDS